ncbi:MAG: tetratricopeptide repeat protein [Proteobacteria bacterium]|nr:tetratricopeptide repeat protein [Pseudomonadota bacterium]
MDRFSSLFGAALIALLIGVPALAQAAPTAPRRDLDGSSGMFLAGVVANSSRDTRSAADYFREALKADPQNPGLLDQSFLSELLDGNMAEAFKLAERSLRRDRSNAMAHVALGVRALKAKEYGRAKLALERAGGNVREPDLTMALLRAWAMAGAGEVSAALASIDKFTGTEQKTYRDFFSGLIADIAKRPAEAEKRLAAAYNADPAVMRAADAYARLLARRGKWDEAREVVTQWRNRNPGQPYLDRLADAIERREALPPMADSMAAGAAEVFYGLAAAGIAGRDPSLALIYIQFAHYLSPQDEVISTTLAEFFEQLQQHQRAATIYSEIPVSSPLANRAAIGRAAALERMEKSDEAIGVLRALLAAHPGDLEAADTLGAILRTKKRWVESIEVYDDVLKAIPSYSYKHWVLFFGRAVGYERSKQWPKAEKDFLAALDLLPAKAKTPRERAERAQVLNYLAYSWVDMRMNIDKSFEMLREAVSLSPGDGAIVDSLGWAYYRLGRYEEAVKELERAVLLRAGDATINDHLGDAYWKVGRQREARFKWSQALDLNPEPEEIDKIRRKLELGLEEAPAANAAAPKTNGG